MKKVKGFKLSLKSREVARRAKKAGIDLLPLGFIASAGPRREPDPTESFEAWLSAPERALQPAVVFESFSAAEAAEPSPLSPMPGLAYSVIVATLGEAWGPARDAEPDPARAAVWPVVEDAALEEAVRFAAGIVEQEAAEDGCTLSPMTVLSEPQALELAAGKVAAEKIGVRFFEGKLAPAASRAVSLSWLAKTRSKGKPK